MKRFYRAQSARGGLERFRVRHKETDLFIQATLPLVREAEALVIESRLAIEEYIRRRPEFLHSRLPLPFDELAPPIVREMLEAGKLASVGPMAAVAGAIAEYVGKGLIKLGAQEVIVENGGDCYVHTKSECTVGIWAGNSPFSGKIGIKLLPESELRGVCTSSGSVGHSLSFGTADAITVVSKSTSLSDAVATSIGNIVRSGAKLKKALHVLENVPGIAGGLIIIGEKLGIVGKIELVTIDG